VIDPNNNTQEALFLLIVKRCRYLKNAFIHASSSDVISEKPTVRRRNLMDAASQHRTSSSPFRMQPASEICTNDGSLHTIQRTQKRLRHFCVCFYLIYTIYVPFLEREERRQLYYSDEVNGTEPFFAGSTELL